MLWSKEGMIFTTSEGKDGIFIWEWIGNIDEDNNNMNFSQSLINKNSYINDDKLQSIDLMESKKDEYNNNLKEEEENKYIKYEDIREELFKDRVDSPNKLLNIDHKELKLMKSYSPNKLYTHNNIKSKLSNVRASNE